MAGNISLEGDLVGTPKLNVLLLLIGTLLSSWIGTTGASMLMIRLEDAQKLVDFITYQDIREIMC